jgi:hypothetical protein
MIPVCMSAHCLNYNPVSNLLAGLFVLMQFVVVNQKNVQFLLPTAFNLPDQ